MTKVTSNNTWHKKLILKRENQSFTAYLCFSRMPLETLQHEKENFLHNKELEYFQKFSVKRRQKSYLIGRYCAKMALSQYLEEPDLTTIFVNQGVFQFPTVYYMTDKNPEVGIAHSDDWGMAIAFSEMHPLGVDIEKIANDSQKEAIKTQITKEEETKVRILSLPESLGYTLLWTAKEALSKILRCGLMTPFKILEINDIEKHPNYTVSTFTNFAQYKCITSWFEDMVFSIALPKYTEIPDEILELNREIIRTLKYS